MVSKQKSMLVKLPEQGFVFWPVGSGDSTTIAVGDDVFMQVDLRHLTCADEDDDDPRVAVIDHLEKILPQVGGKPYLSVFALTHPDEDHCRGFADLLKRVTIGELWHTPRVFREYPRDLCGDAVAFRKEAKRRVAKTIKEGEVGAGDRVRVIGYDDLLKEDDYKGFPAARLTVPGNAVVELDGEDCSDRFRAFVHGPFKGDCAGERNGTSIALLVTLYNGAAAGRAMLLGDLCYPTVKRIFDRSKAADVEWNVFLAPHHCSKSVMYWKGEGDSEETLKQDVLDAIEAAAGSPGYIVASSEPIPASDKSGDNPPHAKAKQRYEEIVPDQFLCTQEHPNEETPEPIIFTLGAGGLQYREPQQGKAQKTSAVAAAVVAARGSSEPPSRRVGFGRRK
jgi:beta-lactamase superfamily II metal-dependent hydrolase